MKFSASPGPYRVWAQMSRAKHLFTINELIYFSLDLRWKTQLLLKTTKFYVWDEFLKLPGKNWPHLSKSIHFFIRISIAWKASLFGDFLARIFSQSYWIGRDTLYLSVFSPNVELQIRTHFTQKGFTLSFKFEEMIFQSNY